MSKPQLKLPRNQVHKIVAAKAAITEALLLYVRRILEATDSLEEAQDAVFNDERPGNIPDALLTDFSRNQMATMVANAYEGKQFTVGGIELEYK